MPGVKRNPGRLTTKPIWEGIDTTKYYSDEFDCMVDDVIDIDAPGQRTLVRLDDGLLVDMPSIELDHVKTIPLFTHHF